MLVPSCCSRRVVEAADGWMVTLEARWRSPAASAAVSAGADGCVRIWSLDSLTLESARSLREARVACTGPWLTPLP